ncbi:MAG: PKD domain-containing protein, partial [Candidatus Bathyarchaeota archaeon]|nr:PKD domain-containing protein [Candidatus Bathyarchaeota archaeon]
ELGMIQITHLEDDEDSARQPLFSPDGTKVAYMVVASDSRVRYYYGEEYYKEIWVMELDFSRGEPRVADNYPVTDRGIQCANLEDWSPDGEQILFRSRDEGDAYNNLWIAQADGSGVEQLTFGRDDACFGGSGGVNQATFSQDGEQILYAMYWYDGYDGYKELFVMDVDGSNVTQLTDTFGQCEQNAKWSPDGSQIIYKLCNEYYRDNASIWIMDADGSNQRCLVENPHSNFFDWSPDGDWVVYERNGYYLDEDDNGSPDYIDGRTDIYKIRADGSHNTLLTDDNDSYCQHTPIWMNDGQILYRSDELVDENGMSSSWIMDEDGDNKEMINPWGGKWQDVSPNAEWLVVQTDEPDETNGYAQLYIVSTESEGVSAGFSANIKMGGSPLMVQFKDTSSSCFTDWYWSFGDGEHSTSSSPTHTYMFEGTYTVTLTVSGECGTETIVMADLITVEDNSSPAALSVQNLNVSSVYAYPGQELQITADVANTGGGWGSDSVALMINGQTEQTASVGVSPGTSQNLAFTVYKTVPGEYQVTIGNAVATFYIMDDGSTEAQQTNDLGTGGIIAIIVIAVLVVAGIVVVFMMTGRKA